MSRPSPSRSACGSSIRNRWIDQARFGACARHPDPGRGRLYAGASLRQRADGLQLLHVPRRHGGGGDLRAGPRRHQRHEPIFARRVQRQFGARRRHRSGARLSGPSAGRDRLAAASWRSRRSSRADRTIDAPGQRVGDFLAGRPSTALGEVVPSYKPGVRLTDLATCLPDFAIEAIREALPAFGRQIAGYDHPDAVLTGVETRTSSPVRITRGDGFPEPQHRAACSRPAKARAMPAASCRRRSTASRWPKRWR